MVNVVSVNEFDLDEGALHTAADTYLNFKSADENQINWNREILNSSQSWLNEHDLTVDTVGVQEAPEDPTQNSGDAPESFSPQQSTSDWEVSRFSSSIRY